MSSASSSRARASAGTASTTSRSPRRRSRRASARSGSARITRAGRASSSRSRSATTPPRRGTLSELLHRWFGEDEIFRIDHYLGKETVQNMLALRFANGIFEPVWNRQFIDHVQITVAESMGIEGRAGFYEESGAIRDVFQNHLLQLLALTAMEPPIDFTADAVRTEKVKALRSLHTPGPKSVVRGQYGHGWVEGQEVAALSRGARCRARLADRDVRRGEALRRQLALGGHAVLRPRRQAARPAGDDDRDPVPACAAPAVRGDRRRRPSPQRPPHPRPARRGSLARDRREGPRRGHVDPYRAHGLPLRRRVPREPARRRTSG